MYSGGIPNNSRRSEKVMSFLKQSIEGNWLHRNNTVVLESDKMPQSEEQVCNRLNVRLCCSVRVANK